MSVMAHASAFGVTPRVKSPVRLARHRTVGVSLTNGRVVVRRADTGGDEMSTPQQHTKTKTTEGVGGDTPPTPPPVGAPQISPAFPVPLPTSVAAAQGVPGETAGPAAAVVRTPEPAVNVNVAPATGVASLLDSNGVVASPLVPTQTRGAPPPQLSSAAKPPPSRGERPVLGKLALTRNDPSLAPYEHLLKARWEKQQSRYETIVANEGSLRTFASAYKTFGLHPSDAKKPGYEKGDVTYTEYAPGAAKLSLMGDFNEWTPGEFHGTVDEFGKWTVLVPASAGLVNGSQVRVAITTATGKYFTRIPAWIRQVTPCLFEGAAGHHNGVYDDGGDDYVWRHDAISDDDEDDEKSKNYALKIYEAHIGMSSEQLRYGTYREFADSHLVRIAALGYNVLQLMAIGDHAYYASFGYQVTNFFAPAHRSGKPNDLKYLIDTAHGLGMKVFMDVVHAHASDNSDDGLNHFDGTDSHYFHDDPQKGWHSLWGTRMFNYGSYETLRFLLSNLKYWQTEFKFDGFRFDGVTAMLYNHRGIHWDFHGGVNEFYGEHADDDACAYLMLANKMLREDEETVIGLDGVEKTSKNKSVTTIAEEVSGQPGVCRPVWHGGLGFDLRLSMGPPDKWGQLAHEPDFNWSPSRIVEICTSRTAEPAVGYLESHDQSLVGDKTFAFRLMDGAMYACMGKFKPEGLPEHQDWQVHPQIERGVALHKIARLLTLTLAGEAWMGFMGNEFGHPDWVDFPREGNGESFAHARRQWSLRDVNGAGKGLFYHDLERFDAALLKCDASHGLLVANKNEERKRVHHIKDDTGVLAFHCGTNLIVCNLHPHESYPYYKVGSEFGGKYKLVLDTDATEFGGHGRLAANQSASTENGACDWQGTGVCLYLPSRSAQVYALIDTWDVPDELYSTHTDNDFGYGSDGGDDTGGGGDDAVW